MNIENEMIEDDNKLEFYFDGSIKINEHEDLYCYVFAKNWLDKLTADYDVNGKEISIKGEYQTMIDLMSDLFYQYGKNIVLVFEDFNSCAKRYTKVDLERYGLNIKDF